MTNDAFQCLVTDDALRASLAAVRHEHQHVLAGQEQRPRSAAAGCRASMITCAVLPPPGRYGPQRAPRFARAVSYPVCGVDRGE